ncbi:MAG: superoxide dismutase [Desulfovibrionales bacterium]
MLKREEGSESGIRTSKMGAGALLLTGTVGLSYLAMHMRKKRGVTGQEEIELPGLPYERSALEPYISSRTMHFHHDRHHAGYVRKAGELAEHQKMADMPLQELIRQTAHDTLKQSLFENAAQVFNHAFFWQCMKPEGGGKPGSRLMAAIQKEFRTFEGFTRAFKDAALKRFGSGWAWLALDGDRIRVLSTPNADNPLTRNMVPLLTLDVWEHAYYLDYQNERDKYVQTFMNHLVNWDFAEANLKSAL